MAVPPNIKTVICFKDVKEGIVERTVTVLADVQYLVSSPQTSVIHDMWGIHWPGKRPQAACCRAENAHGCLRWSGPCYAIGAI